MYWHDGMSGWGYGFMAISMLLFWGLVILAGVALVRYLIRADQRSGGSPTTPTAPPTVPRTGSSAEDVLAERFARGEIDTEEYERRLATLRGATRSAP